MSKFSVEVELKLKIQGDRHDASLISRTVGKKFSDALGPIDAIIEGTAHEVSRQPNLPFEEPNLQAFPKAKRRRNTTASPGSSKGDGAEALDFKADPLKYGNPRQAWSTAKKSLWLLYVAKEVAGVSEMSAPVISKTFNKHFRQSGTIQTGKVTRDLGKLKSETPAPVQEDTTKPDAPWFLTDAGIKRAQTLVEEALTPA